MNVEAKLEAGRHAPYSHAELERLINPASIAVIGASETAGSFGANTLANIRESYKGKIFPINPKRESVFGSRCYPNVAALPEAPDCAIVIVPASSVAGTLEECAAAGIGSAIVYSSGFAELGTSEAIAAQSALTALAGARGLRIIGPNCIGIANIGLGLGATFMPSFRELPLKQGPVGIVTQSGALGYMMLQAMRRNVGFSHWLTTGNACDVDVADFVNYLVDDRATRAIACSFEGLSCPERFLFAGRRALEAGKPLVVLKVGRTEASRQAALSHTGSMVGSSAAYDAALESIGAIVVRDFEALVETAGFLAKSSVPAAKGSAVITMSGGAGIMALDLASETGVEMPTPAQQTCERIAAVVPEFGAATNPADLTGESIRFPQMYADCLEAFAQDPIYGSIIIVMASGGYGQLAIDRARLIEKAAAGAKKPVAIVWLNEWLEGPGSEIYDGSDVLSSFRSLRRCLSTIASWNAYHERRAKLLRRPMVTRRTERPAKALGVKGALNERHSKELLASFGVPVTREYLARTKAEAVSLAKQLGFPVVLKAESEDIPHKSDAGVVKLRLYDEDAVGNAWHEIQQAIDRLEGSPRVSGCLVQEMIHGGAEVIVGTKYDDQFGALVTVGLGGVAVEVLHDVAVALAPVEIDEALDMIQSLKSIRLLQGFRGAEKADLNALADIISKVSKLASTYGSSISEIDVNPVLVKSCGAVAVDGLVVAGHSQITSEK